MSSAEITGTLSGVRSHGSRTLSEPRKVMMALAATWSAGFVDATGYMLLSHIYTSNMTGNSIEISMHFIEGKWLGVIQRGWPVLMFVCGLVLGAVITEACVRRGFLSYSAITLGLEAALIGIFIPLGTRSFHAGQIQVGSFWHFNMLVSLLAFSMGLQNQTITRLGALSIHTTHVTGVLTNLGAELSEYLFWLRDRAHSFQRFVLAIRISPRQEHFRNLGIHVGLWSWFVIGAICAVFAKEHWQVHGLMAPVFVLVVLVGIDIVRPISASAEQKEIEAAHRR